MNVKDTINYKMLRDKGKSIIDIKDDEAIQLVSKNTDIKVIVTQEHYLNLLSAYNALLVKYGYKEESLVDIGSEDVMNKFKKRMNKIAKLVNEDSDK